jgi:hypothetical protein
MTKVQRPAEQSGLLLGERPLAPGLPDDVAELLRRCALAQAFRGFDTKRAQQAVGGVVEQPDDRPGQACVELRDGREPEGERLGACDREVLRPQLAEHHLRHGRQQQGERERDAGGGRLADAHAQQQGPQGLAERGLRQVPHHQRCHRDAELRARQHERQPAQHAERPLRVAAPLVRQLLQP